MKQSEPKRILRILNTLQSEQNYRINDLVHTFELSRRTIYRDLREIRAAGVPCHYDKRIRLFKLNQIMELTTLDECFVKDEKFDVFEHIGRAWSMVSEGRFYNVKLQFLSGIANDVAMVQWHSTQKVVFEEDGSAIIEFRVDGLNEIKWWILGYGNRVQVITPQVLRQEVIKIAEEILISNRREMLN